MWIRFAWGEFASYGAAISTLADELKAECEYLANKQDREALSRSMLKWPSGCVSVGANYLHWRKVEEFQRDIEYCFHTEATQPE